VRLKGATRLTWLARVVPPPPYSCVGELIGWGGSWGERLEARSPPTRVVVEANGLRVRVLVVRVWGVGGPVSSMSGGPKKGEVREADDRRRRRGDAGARPAGQGWMASGPVTGCGGTTFIRVRKGRGGWRRWTAGGRRDGVAAAGGGWWRWWWEWATVREGGGTG
jgi:hypothetical protein